MNVFKRVRKFVEALQDDATKLVVREYPLSSHSYLLFDEIVFKHEGARVSAVFKFKDDPVYTLQDDYRVGQTFSISGVYGVSEGEVKWGRKI